MRKKRYSHCCIKENNVPALIEMIDSARDITYQTFIRNCAGALEMAAEMGYGGRLKLKNDPYVSYHKSKYLGKPCYYMRHSAIEYIWR